MATAFRHMAAPKILSAMEGKRWVVGFVVFRLGYRARQFRSCDNMAAGYRQDKCVDDVNILNVLRILYAPQSGGNREKVCEFFGDGIRACTKIGQGRSPSY